jgi:pimeloyl-ACP methyl ester carboxylesterase
VRAFLLTNLVPSTGDDGGATWRFRVNVRGLASALDAIAAFDASACPPVASVPTLVLGGSRGRYVTAAHHPVIHALFPQARIVMLPTGHWVHAEAPQEFLAEVTGFLSQVSPTPS